MVYDMEHSPKWRRETETETETETEIRRVAIVVAVTHLSVLQIDR